MRGPRRWNTAEGGPRPPRGRCADYPQARGITEMGLYTNQIEQHKGDKWDLVQKSRGIIDRAEKENRSALTTEERAEFDRMAAAIAGHEERIADLEKINGASDDDAQVEGMSRTRWRTRASVPGSPGRSPTWRSGTAGRAGRTPARPTARPTRRTSGRART